MKYRIMNESAHRIRFRLYCGGLSPEQEDVLTFALSDIAGVEKVTVYRATAGLALEYSGDREHILKKLDAFRFENVTMLAKTEHPVISLDEVRDRKLDPALKRRLRMRVLLETAADLALPVPVQIGYHVYQMITLKDI